MAFFNIVETLVLPHSATNLNAFHYMLNRIRPTGDDLVEYIGSDQFTTPLVVPHRDVDGK